MNTTIKKLDSTQADFKPALFAMLAHDTEADEGIDRTTAAILAEVKQRGDAAVLEYTQRLDHVQASSMTDLEAPLPSLQHALMELPMLRRHALQAAADRILAYHERQKQESASHSFLYTEADGTILGQKITALDRVGIYVPGGQAAYPSSVLMNAIPAKVAGVGEIIMVTPTPNGASNALVLAAAAIAGVDRVFTIGGAQAIGALAYGTATIAPVDKIVGPGNAYVTAAKRQVFGTVGIDMIAGPSEICIICDGSVDPDWVAMDLLAQAEHDQLARSILLCPDTAYLSQVEASIASQLTSLPRHDIIHRSLSQHSALVKVQHMDEACDIANLIAPEHLEIAAEQPRQWANKIRHAGALFLGRFSATAFGDYCAGPNHVLPTARTARFSSALGVYDFQKRSSVIEVSMAGAAKLGKIAAELAYGEGLEAHARSAQYRDQAQDRAALTSLAEPVVASQQGLKQRIASVTRATNETQIHVTMNLDGSGQYRGHTGIPVLDHMLDQVVRYSLLDLDITAQGDLHIDAHHTVEDIGITLGQACAKAIGAKKGIGRYGYAYVPLDEALSRVVIDFAGRPRLEYHLPFTRSLIGTFDVDLVREFFQGFVNHAQVGLHIDNLRGINAHHQCETVFKAFGRALRMAIALDPRAAQIVPSTKGSL